MSLEIPLNHSSFVSGFSSMTTIKDWLMKSFHFNLNPFSSLRKVSLLDERTSAVFFLLRRHPLETNVHSDRLNRDRRLPICSLFAQRRSMKLIIERESGHCVPIKRMKTRKLVKNRMSKRRIYIWRKAYCFFIFLFFDRIMFFDIEEE